MKAHNAQVIGVGFGIALFVAVGLLLTTGTGPGAGVGSIGPSPPMRAGQIDPSVVTAAERLGDAFAMVAAHVKPSVVSVYSEKTTRFSLPELSDPFDDELFRRFFGEPFSTPQRPDSRRHEFRQRLRGMGSGMIVDKQGHVLTNFHVVQDVDAIKVTLADKRTFDAKIVGTDPKTDVAVLKIEGRIPADLPTIALGDSDALKVGNLVLAIGAPFGLAQTVTEGILSATGRSDVGVADYEDLLQTDAPINPGNSGGPLVNMRGEVVGMNTAIASGIGQYAGVGFAIPSNMVKTLLAKLTSGQKIVRGQLGVGIQDVTKELAGQFGMAEPKGVLISAVTKNSPAARAGLKSGDVITRFGGDDVRDGRHLRNLVAATAPGTTIKIELLRDGKPTTVTATIDQQAEEVGVEVEPAQPAASRLDKLGIAVQTLTPELAKQLHVDATKGVVISELSDDGLAAMAGLRKGDVIVEANRTPVASADELTRVLTKAKDPRSVLFLIKRQDASLFVVIRW
jgi:serine protease Do